MSLNVKDPEAYRLAQAIARETGETLTRAVTESPRERYERIQRRRGRASVDELCAIAKRTAGHAKRPYLDLAETALRPTRPSQNDPGHPRWLICSAEPCTVEQAQIARQAFHDFGKGRHPAGLNFGDCFARAFAKITGEPLLFKGGP
jgi:antitoxin VapB